MKAKKLTPIVLAIAFALTGCSTGAKQVTTSQEVKSGEKVTSDAEINKEGVKTNKVEAGDYKIIKFRASSSDKSAPARIYNLVEAADRLNKKLEKEGAKERVQVEATLAEAKDEVMRQNIIFLRPKAAAPRKYTHSLSIISAGWPTATTFCPLMVSRKIPLSAN